MYYVLALGKWLGHGCGRKDHGVMIWEPFAEFWQLLQRMPSFAVSDELRLDYRRFYVSSDGPCILTGKVE